MEKTLYINPSFFHCKENRWCIAENLAFIKAARQLRPSSGSGKSDSKGQSSGNSKKDSPSPAPDMSLSSRCRKFWGGEAVDETSAKTDETAAEESNSAIIEKLDDPKVEKETTSASEGGPGTVKPKETEKSYWNNSYDDSSKGPEYAGNFIAIPETLLVKTPKKTILLVRECNSILNLSNVYVKIFYRVVEVTTTLTTDFHFWWFHVTMTYPFTKQHDCERRDVTMISYHYVISTNHGLHAANAMSISRAASEYQCKIALGSSKRLQTVKMSFLWWPWR